MSHLYLESGLDNVRLENGFTLHSTAYGEGLSIADSDGLHRAIGLWLVGRRQPLDGAALRFVRLEMELTQDALAALLGTTEQTLRRWEKARGQALAGPADRLLRLLFSEWLGRAEAVQVLADRLAGHDPVPPAEGRFRHGPGGWREVVEAAVA